MTTRFYTPDAGSQFDCDELIQVLEDVGEWGKPFRVFEWNTESDFYGIVITTDPDMTPERAEELFYTWQRSDFDDSLLS